MHSVHTLTHTRTFRKRCVMLLSGPFAVAAHYPCRFMRPAWLTLSGGSYVAQIIHPSATAPPAPLGRPSHGQAFMDRHINEDVEGPAHVHTHTHRLLQCHTHSFAASFTIHGYFLSLCLVTITSSFFYFYQSVSIVCFYRMACWETGAFLLDLYLTAHVCDHAPQRPNATYL